MEKIRSTKLVLGNDYNKRATNQKLYLLPHQTELADVNEALGGVKVCKHAMMALLRYGRRAWDTCKKSVDNGTIPEHGLTGKVNVRSKRFKEEVEPGLLEFFNTVVVPLSGARPSRATAENSGAVIRDYENTLELDPEWTKRRLFARYCYDLGYHVIQGAGGAVKFEERVDAEWTESGAECGARCSLTAFFYYWKRTS
jgi:hypothetical protein